MADQVNQPEKTPEEIEREMLQTREALTEKVAALENQVVGTVQTAADTLTGTVEAVKSLVNHAPEKVTETVRQASAAMSDALKGTFDISSHVREHPWVAVGLSALVGGIVGAMIAPRRGAGGSFSPFAEASGPIPAAAHPASTSSQPVAAVGRAAQPGIFDEVRNALGAKVRELADTALNALSTSLKSTLETTVPKLVDQAASHLTETESNDAPETLAARFDARRTQGS
ncbi:DUF883 C-terminal domain-containing protein [Gemmata sp. JC673]|uniref:DUF883 C-terminal domain-containing protein n=1 Tax=Gemmata algarum TaxID=2975278 RepID=A0ABU5F7S5_9BACT|nr:DUF883 C-terminal domain-containing protein [Gemmata algarum]MDY3562770.1 DUF883 C-terminal domain-containing protein [Gemmata algarum]